MIPAWILAQVPGLKDARVPGKIHALGAGTVNRAFLVETEAGRFVVRLDRAAMEVPGVDRTRERLLHACAARAGLAPEICVGGEGFTVTRYVEGRGFEPGDFVSLAGIATLGQALMRVHALAPPVLASPDPVAMARSYAERIVARDPEAAGALGRELEALAREVERSRPGERPKTIVHLDLHHDNVIAGAQVVLLDWEFAQVGDPLLDLAGWLAYYPQAATLAPLLLEHSGLQASASVGMLLSLAAAFGRLTALWYEALECPVREARESGAGGIRSSSAD